MSFQSFRYFRLCPKACVLIIFLNFRCTSLLAVCVFVFVPNAGLRECCHCASAFGHSLTYTAEVNSRYVTVISPIYPQHPDTTIWVTLIVLKILLTVFFRSENTAHLVYRFPHHDGCHEMCRRMQASCVIKLPCSGNRLKGTAACEMRTLCAY